jgi:hypothetical protein
MNKLVGTKVKKKQESNNLIIIYLNRFFLDFIYTLFLFLIYRKRAFSPTKIDNFVKSEKFVQRFSIYSIYIYECDK